MIISLVVAASENNVIGKNNQLLWRLPNDMKFFKNTTWGMPIVMGRKTFDSMGKALKGRTNIVITRNNKFAADDIHVAQDFHTAVSIAESTDAKELYVIGGGEIYQQALPLAQRIYLTRVHSTFEGDAFFPTFNSKEWSKKSETHFATDEKHPYPYSFELWERVSD